MHTVKPAQQKVTNCQRLTSSLSEADIVRGEFKVETCSTDKVGSDNACILYERCEGEKRHQNLGSGGKKTEG